MAEGVMPGGGATFVHLSRKIPILKKDFQDSDEKIGADCRHCWNGPSAPAKFIAENAVVDGDVVVEKILSSDSRVGCNAMNGRYEDLIAARVVDPCRVSKCALQNAVSIAGIILTTQAILVEKTRKTKPILLHVPEISP